MYGRPLGSYRTDPPHRKWDRSLKSCSRNVALALKIPLDENTVSWDLVSEKRKNSRSSAKQVDPEALSFQ